MHERFIFSSSGEAVAFVDGQDVFTMDGLWIGVTPDGWKLFDKAGAFVGYFLEDGRVATDPSRPTPAPINPPTAKTTRGIPLVIPRRPTMPRLPRPFKEASLEVSDLTAQPISFVATQIALWTIIAGAAVLLGTKIAIGEAESGLTLEAFRSPSTWVLGVLAGIVGIGAALVLKRSRRSSIKLLVLGSDLKREMTRKAIEQKFRGFKVVEAVSEEVPQSDETPEVRAALARRGFDYVVLANALNDAGEFSTAFRHAMLEPRLVDLPILVEREFQKLPLEARSTVVFFQRFAAQSSPLERLLRRLVDVVAASLMLFCVAPVIFATALLIKLESRGPALIAQKRVGKGGRIFRLYKFRTMRLDAEKDGAPRWATKVDSRITRLGRFIRLTRLDELPTLINVLQGDMSMVGPRPEPPFFVEHLSEQLPMYNCRHLVRPGVTGWAQTHYLYGSTMEDAVEKLSYDLYYVKHRSIILDLTVMLQTLGAVFTGRSIR